MLRLTIRSTQELAKILGFLGNEQRLAILKTIAENEKYAREISEELGISRPLVNIYLKQLEKIGKSELTEEIQKRVMTLTTNMSDQLAQETRIQSSPEELDIKRYVAQVIQEVKEKNRKF